MNSKDKLDSKDINTFLEQDEKFQIFLTLKTLKTNTIKGYKYRINEYSQAIGLTPTEFLQEAEKEEYEGIKLKRRKIKTHLIKFIQYLRRKDLKDTSINNYLIYIKAFYSTFEIELPKLTIKLNAFPKKDNKEWLSKEDIKKALKYSNYKYKAIILLMLSSGMGSAEIRNLTFKNFLKSIEEYIIIRLKEPYNVEDIKNSLPHNQIIIPTWHIQRVKTGEYYYTFSSPESAEAILDYLEYREAKNKPIIGLNEPLFIGRRPGDILNKYTMTSAFQKINDNAGFKTVGNKRYFTSHELTRFFASQTLRAGLQEKDVKWLRGQKPRETLNRYVISDANNLKIQYMEKALRCLSIETLEILKLEEDTYRQLRDLKKENRELKGTVQNIKKRMELIEQFLNNNEYQNGYKEKKDIKNSKTISKN
jgi:integrase